MKAWFQALSERERNLVLLSGFLLVALLAYFYGWKPLLRYHSELERDIKLTLEDREFIKQAEGQVQVSGAGKKEQEGRGYSHQCAVIGLTRYSGVINWIMPIKWVYAQKQKVRT